MGSRAGLCYELFSGKVCRQEQVASQPKARSWQFFGTFSGPGWGARSIGDPSAPQRDPTASLQACSKVTVPGPLPMQPCRAVRLTGRSRPETLSCAVGHAEGSRGSEEGLRVWAGDHPSLQLDLRVRTQ